MIFPLLSEILGRDSLFSFDPISFHFAVVLIWQLYEEIQLVRFLPKFLASLIWIVSKQGFLLLSFAINLSGEYSADDAWEFPELEEAINKEYI